MTEEWRMMLIAPKYEVSNYGRIRNVKTGHIKRYNFSSGYAYVSLSRSMSPRLCLVARQVLMAFTPHMTDLTATVGYRDGNRANLRLDNLCWVSQRELRAKQWASGCMEGRKHRYLTPEEMAKGLAALRRIWEAKRLARAKADERLSRIRH